MAANTVARPTRHRQRSLLYRYYTSKAGLPLTLGLIVCLVWEFGARGISPLIMAPLSKIAVAWWQIATNGILLKAFTISIQSLIVGYCLAIVVGGGIGILMGRYRYIEYLLTIYVTFFLTTPMIAIVPVMVIFFGFTLTARIAIVFFFSWIYILVNSFAGIREANPALLEMARSFGTRERDVFLKVILPGAMPSIMAGLRIGAARAVLGMLVSEFLLATVGLGEIMIQYENTFDNPHLWAVILTVVALGIFVVAIVKRIEQRVLVWHEVATVD